jgi:hypothetical protein
VSIRSPSAHSPATALLSENYSDILALMLSIFNAWTELFTGIEKADDLTLFKGTAIALPASRALKLIDVVDADLQKTWSTSPSYKIDRETLPLLKGMLHVCCSKDGPYLRQSGLAR